MFAQSYYRKTQDANHHDDTKSGISTADQSLSLEGRELSNPRSTIRDLGVQDKAMVLLRKKVTVAGR